MKACTHCGAAHIPDPHEACTLCGAKSFDKDRQPGTANTIPYLPARATRIPGTQTEVLVWTEPLPANAPPLLGQPGMQAPGPRLRQAHIRGQFMANGLPEADPVAPPLSSGYRLYPDEKVDLQELASTFLLPPPLGGADDSRNVVPVVKGVFDRGQAKELLDAIAELATGPRTTTASLGGSQTFRATPPELQMWLYYHADGDARIPVWFYAQLYRAGQPFAHFSFPNFVGRGGGDSAASPSADEAKAFTIAHQALNTADQRGQRIAPPYAALQWLHDQYYGAPDSAVVSTDPQLAAYLEARKQELGGRPLTMSDLAPRYRKQLKQSAVSLLGLPEKPVMKCEPLDSPEPNDAQRELVLKHNAWWYQAPAGQGGKTPPPALRSDLFGSAAAQYGEPMGDLYDVLDANAAQAAPFLDLIQPERGNRYDNLKLVSTAFAKRQRPSPPEAIQNEARVKADVDAMWARHQGGLRAFYQAITPDLVERWSAFQARLNGPVTA